MRNRQEVAKAIIMQIPLTKNPLMILQYSPEKMRTGTDLKRTKKKKEKQRRL